jgi:cold shock CspA family protein
MDLVKKYFAIFLGLFVFVWDVLAYASRHGFAFVRNLLRKKPKQITLKSYIRKVRLEKFFNLCLLNKKSILAGSASICALFICALLIVNQSGTYKYKYEEQYLEIGMELPIIAVGTEQIVKYNETIASKAETVGVALVPEKINTGTFIWPAYGNVTSGYKYRWGRLHTGIDIGVRYAPVYAADGGTVTFAGNSGDGYGKKIIINHGDGRQTVYAHLSEISVSVYEEVHQGVKIGVSGNSGSSTGPHLHFEILINGVPKNPLNYF